MLRKSKSFGLIETLIACGILMMVAGGTTTLGVLSVHGTVVAKHKTEAYNIAQEAMEKIKGTRDWVWDNWSETGGVTWDNFWNGTIPGSDNDFSDIRNSLSKSLGGKCVFIDHNTGVLQEAACGGSGLGLEFTRAVSDPIDVSADIFGSGVTDRAYKITVTVSWLDYGQTHSVSLTSYLTNWKPRY